jgi:hypothetical protein
MMAGRRALAILPPEPAAYCAPWHLRAGEEIHGARCCRCDREVAVPHDLKRLHVACIYCGMESGAIPEIEVEPQDRTGSFLRRVRKTKRRAPSPGIQVREIKG